MFVCLCNGVTSQTVTEAVEAGACTTKDVARACGAGADCGRCRLTVQAILRSSNPNGATARPGPEPGR
ncbi:(2Fe-2S)-binding protein [Mycobacterium malmoense]|uniref:Bacterioferritin-associated ferredoxin n=1 Tax=Mycobacterium malmoense TaxID=1780 RepID=A0A1B9DAQ8_MYCMA|nr:(2Fe-2S)-binding protein [Mycobacterium malmoense]OCB25086.1 (2Fe-2S)-binding protein [Mycobacterium malmoense]OCB28894.1 (2Fe-2S)-binding protein [Mycobacterium malmoense]OCB57837.1 (2Fe-2S)-binding protein [Mycobacterium malmoense]